MIKLLSYLLLSILTIQAHADKLRIREDVKIISVSGEIAELEIKVSWSNSWRNASNYDAVYLFAKYREDNTPEWNHLFFDDTPSSSTVSPGYTLTPVNGGRGLLLYRATESAGSSEATLRLKWKINGNKSNPLTAAQLNTQKIYTSFHCLEMVYVPTSPFYAGDGSSSNSFSQPDFGIFPPEHDLIGTNNYTYTGNGSETAAAHVNRPADRYNQGEHLASNRHDWCGTTFPAYWQVDFKAPKTILYFGVSGVCWQDYPCAPSGTWYLEGSANATTWTPLWDGGPENWNQSSISYPVQRRLKVKTPGSYRYYRIRADNTQNTHLWNNIRISNVSMTDTDLGQQPSVSGILQGGLSSSLPSNYPTGVTGFYSMKYELSQEQYVAYLNQQPRSAQYVRTIGGLLDGLSEGDYVFGDNHTRASSRNGIIVHERRLNSGSPYLFACNLNPSNLANSLDDGQNLACNYLSPSDLLSYADWSGLRPLSELEYEKMCRGYYPAHPAGGAYSWETTSLTPATSVTSAGTETETPQGSTSNANAGGFLPGPARTGLFVRPGSRLQSGTSYWGLSDLSGNLSEIYCNAELYGRQLNRTVHGSGSLAENGSHTVPRSAWPQEADAYGVRGGDYTSSSSSLSVSDRSHAVGYFRSLTDRQATVGFRLGYSHDPLRSVSVLTLENGRTSGNVIVYDTVCDASEYTIRGDKPGVGDEPCHYIWYRSMDEGITWQKLEDSHNCDLRIVGLESDLGGITLKKFLYKRMGYNSGLITESGVVGVVLASGYSVSRLVDTLQPCMASPGFEIKTPLPATFEWHYLDNNKKLKAIRGTETESFYMASTADIKTNGKLDGGEYHLEVSIKLKKGCSYSQDLKLAVLPWTKKPWDENEVIKVTDSDADSRQLVTGWGGQDEQKWSITSMYPGALKIDSLTGVLRGMAQTMCNITINLVCADFPDRVYTKAVKETFRDWYFLEPGTPRTLTLLPGKYKMECMGSQGGSFSGSAPGGLGGDVWGYIELLDVQKFYIYVGRTPYSATEGGYNGGGGSSSASLSIAAGGATDVRLIGGAWNDPVSLESRIMVAGGGGSSGHTGTGGHGGGLAGGNGSSYTVAGGWGLGGTQTAAGYSSGTPAGFGQGGKGYEHGGGGGGGYYGGGGGRCPSGVCCGYAGGGGSGYVSGFSGCLRHSSGLIFQNPGMKSGVRSGNGYVRIEQL